MPVPLPVKHTLKNSNSYPLLIKIKFKEVKPDMVDKNCKYFRHEPYMTPNNYDIYLSPEEIPANIKKENAYNLKKKLQKLMPLGKIIHINYDTNPETLTESNQVNISTRMLLNGKEVDLL